MKHFSDMKYFLPSLRSEEHNIADNRKRQLLIDVSVIISHDANTGIQRVVRALWIKFREFSDKNIVIRPIFATRKNEYRYADKDFLENLLEESVENPDEITISPGDIFLGLDFASHILPRHKRQIRSWKRHGVSIHVLVYDLLPLAGRQWFHRRTRHNFRKWVSFLARWADSAICISRAVAKDLENYLVPRRTLWGKPGAKLKIASIRLGADIDASRTDNRARPASFTAFRPDPDRPMILMVGTVEPRKAYDKALEAFEHIWRGGFSIKPDLVIAGKPGWKTDGLQSKLRSHPEKGRRLHWLETADDDCLRQLYESCTGLLFTSHAEGYGLPLVEARNHGRAVLARDIPVFREIGDGGVSFFQDDRPALLAERIEAWIADIQSGEMPPANYPQWADAFADLMTVLDLEVEDARSALLNEKMAITEVEL